MYIYYLSSSRVFFIFIYFSNYLGEPINPEAWLWYHKFVGAEKSSIVDTYWQTETGGHVITPLPGCTPTKPGSACFPFFGVLPVILDEDGKELEGETEGYIAFKKPWPGIMRTVYGNQERFESTYFSRFPGYYMSGDGARRDADGYLWITGRVDDMLNCSGKYINTYLLCTDFRSTESYACLLIEIKNFMTT